MSYLLRPHLFFLFLFWVFPVSADASPQNEQTVEAGAAPFVLVSAHEKRDYFGVLAELVYQDAFQRMGRKLVIRYAPLQRVEVLHRNAQVDGDVGRTDAFQFRFPELIRVAESTVIIRYVVYSASPDVRVNNWYDLLQSSLRIEYLRGDMMSDKRLKDIASSGQVSQVDTLTLGLRKLFAGRTDLFIGVQRGVEHVMTKQEFRGQKLYLAGVLDAFEAHVYLRPQYEELAKQLSDVLAEMKREGVIEYYQEQALLLIQ